jgi:hypothetical protein
MTRLVALAAMLGALSACSDWSRMHPADELANLPQATEESSMPYDMAPTGVPVDPAEDRNDHGDNGNGPS